MPKSDDEVYGPLKAVTGQLMESIRELKECHANFRTQELQTFVFGTQVGHLVAKIKTGQRNDALDSTSQTSRDL
jgi:hypothetical protein